MQQTSNYNLNKPEGSDAININDLNENFDVLDTELKKVSDKANIIQTAGGSATEITLENVNLVNGFTISFVVAVSNNGLATKINGKKIYKPGTTTSPKLIAGKAVTLWFDEVGDCFFIKASAEGDAIADNVLAGKTFSNDDDVGLTGTIPNLAGVTTNASTTAVTGQNTGYIEITVPKGYYDGTSKIRLYDADFVTGNLKAGADAFGLVGNSNVVDTSAGDALASQILNGKKAYVDGALVTGNIPSKAAATYIPSTVDQTIALGQYLSGNQTIKGSANLLASYIMKDIDIFGVIGTLIQGLKYTSGVATSSTVTGSFRRISGETLQQYYVTVNSLTFKPTLIVMLCVTGESATQRNIVVYRKNRYTAGYDTISWWYSNRSYIPSLVILNDKEEAYSGNYLGEVTATKFCLPSLYSGVEHKYIAIDTGSFEI